jgi:hypothetical protein
MNITGEIMFFSIQYEMVALRFVFYVLILSTIYSFTRNIFRVSEKSAYKFWNKT